MIRAWMRPALLVWATAACGLLSALDSVAAGLVVGVVLVAIAVREPRVGVGVEVRARMPHVPGGGMQVYTEGSIGVVVDSRPMTCEGKPRPPWLVYWCWSRRLAWCWSTDLAVDQARWRAVLRMAWLGSVGLVLAVWGLG